LWCQSSYLTCLCSCRQYDDTLNVFEGVFRNWLFMSVSAIMIGLQILIIFVGGQTFPLTGPQWAISLVPCKVPFSRQVIKHSKSESLAGLEQRQLC
jgi:hypothetical protein